MTRSANRLRGSALACSLLSACVLLSGCGSDEPSLQQAIGTGSSGSGTAINPNVQASWFRYFKGNAGQQFGFTLALREFGRDRGYDTRLTDDGRFELIDRQAAFEIDELAKLVAESPSKRDELIKEKLGEWIDRLESFDDWTTPSWDEAKDQLFLKLYDVEFFALGGYDESNTLSRQDLPGIYTTIVFENKFAQVTMPRSALEIWEKPEVTAFEVAARNTLAALDREEITRETKALDGLEGLSLQALTSPHAALASLTLDRFPELIGSRGTLFVLPVQQSLYAVPLNERSDARAIDGLQALAEAAVGKELHLSAGVFWRRKDGEILRFDFTNEDAPWPKGFLDALR